MRMSRRRGGILIEFVVVNNNNHCMVSWYILRKEETSREIKAERIRKEFLFYFYTGGHITVIIVE